MRAEEPSEDMLSSISYRIDLAAAANEESDGLLAKRAQMLGAFMKPLIWLDLVSTDGLSDSQAKRVSERLGIKDANDTLAGVARQTLREVRELTAGRRPFELPRPEYHRYAELRGFLQEATVVLLGNRANTAKLVVLPTLQFEDALQPDRRSRADGVLYDNRKGEAEKRKYPYQVKSNDTVEPSRYSIPVVYGSVVGNNKLTAGWSGNSSYATLRNLLAEREGGKISAAVSSNLDRIWGNVRNTIMETSRKKLVIPSPSQIMRDSA